MIKSLTPYYLTAAMSVFSGPQALAESSASNNIMAETNALINICRTFSDFDKLDINKESESYYSCLPVITERYKNEGADSIEAAFTACKTSTESTIPESLGRSKQEYFFACVAGNGDAIKKLPAPDKPSPHSEPSKPGEYSNI